MTKEKELLIVLTGATRGLGRAMVKRFAEMGHSVVGCGRNQELLDSLQASVSGRCELTAIDVVDRESVERWAEFVCNKYGAPDFLLNNAALIHENVPFWELSAEAFDRVIDVNLKGMANVTRAFLPAMRSAEKGVIVNFSSGYGHSTAPGVSAYCCSKFGVEGFTQALAHDLPNGLSAIPMSPGIINTEMLQTTAGSDAHNYETPELWVEKAVPYILSLGAKDNGVSKRVPQ